MICIKEKVSIKNDYKFDFTFMLWQNINHSKQDLKSSNMLKAHFFNGIFATMILIVNLLAYIKCIVLYLYLHFKNAIIRFEMQFCQQHTLIANLIYQTRY